MPRPSPARLRAACVLLLLAGAGCGGIGVRASKPVELLDAWRDSIGLGGGLSPRTQQTLRRLDLEHVYRHDRALACARLHAEALAEPQPDLLFALAEIHHQRGCDAEDHHHVEAVAHFYLAAGYAWHYLFATADAGRDDGPLRARRLIPLDAFDPRFRLACDLYNAGLARCLAAAQRHGHLDPRRRLHLPTPDGQGFTLSVTHVGFPWRPEEFGPLRLCDDFQVVGLANQHRTYGLGVPLIADRSANAPPPGHAFYPPGVSFPVTAFFRFEGGLADLLACRRGTLELYNPLTVQSVSVDGRAVPLETDLTTPLAYFLAHADLETLPYLAFLRPDRFRGNSGLYLLEPYVPGKIPVVLVHGLLSSPLTWAPLVNDLRADPLLRDRYQFWFYFYPTGSPYLATAADLRRDLAAARTAFDPQGGDPAFEQTVLIGHSMGGLVSRLLTVDSGDDFWALASDRPLAGLKIRPSTRQELQEVFYFRRQPCVRRVVFLGTPHHGSRLSPALPGRLADHLTRLPANLLDAAQDLAQGDPGLEPALRAGELPTSVDLLAPGSPALELLAARPRPAGVHYHSVIGIAPPGEAVLVRLLSGAACEEGDGVVPYRSAHIDAAESELIVPADHQHVHHHPLAVREVSRILREHLRQTGDILPVQGQQ
jgi:hypothetical protein